MNFDIKNRNNLDFFSIVSVLLHISRKSKLATNQSFFFDKPKKFTKNCKTKIDSSEL